MYCNKCGAVLEQNAKFCNKCGNNIQSNVEMPSMNQNMNVNQTVNQVQNDGNNFNNSYVNNNILYNNQNIQNNVNQSNKSNGLFALIVGVIIKPIKTYEENNDQLKNMKNSLITTGFVTAFMLLATILSTLLSLILVKQYDFSTGKIVTKIVFDNLSEINYLNLIFKNLIIYAAIFFVIAGIFYLSSLVVKKQTNYMKLLYIVSLSLIPAIVCSYLLSPILNYVWIYLGTSISIIGRFYSLFILYELINREVVLDKDKKLYYNLICFSIISIASLFI